MSQRSIESVYFLPPLAIGRVGGGETPLDSFIWGTDRSIHGAHKTIISPAMSLEVLPDGSLRPYLPNALQLRQWRNQRYPEPTAELAERIAADGVQHETRFREIKDALSPFFFDLSYLRKDFREGNKTECKRAIEPLRVIKDSLRRAYKDAADNQFAKSGQNIAAARVAMNSLLDVGEKLAARNHIGIPFFRIWNDLP